MFCTELLDEERCLGCPINVATTIRPHEAHQVHSAVSELLGSQESDLTTESFAEAVTTAQNELEPSVRKWELLVRDVAIHRVVGNCQYYDGVVLIDMDGEQEFIRRISKVTGENNGKDI